MVCLVFFNYQVIKGINALRQQPQIIGYAKATDKKRELDEEQTRENDDLQDDQNFDDYKTRVIID